MIQKVGLTNFKCFSAAEVAIDQLNVFAGANGTGKSSVIQALLLLFQSFQSGHIERKSLQLNGKFVDLGTGRDVLFKRSNEDRFEILVADDRGSRSFVASVPASESSYTLSLKIDPIDGDLSFLNRKILYLSADRLGPQKSYPMSMDDSFDNDVGRRGEFAPLLYAQSRPKQVTNQLLLLETADKKRFRDLETQFGLWMSRLFPGFQAHTDNLEKMDSILLGLNLQTQIGEPEFFRPANVGFGVSIAFPIVLMGLLADLETSIFVENPEAHLHPSAQSLLGEFLARVAASGTQVFVETHSDHVVNGMRVAFKNGLIASEHLRFFAFTKAAEFGSHRISTVTLDDAGDFKGRPESFFDQADKDLSLIYGLA